MINLVLEAIVEKFPQNHPGPIFVQLDNAPAHVGLKDNPEWVDAVEMTRLDIHLLYQLSNSPDLNILDVGFFHSLAAHFRKKPADSYDDILREGPLAFDELKCQKLDDNFITLQSNMNSIIRLQGGNRYKTEHMGKQSA
jgi:hypothetical protein